MFACIYFMFVYMKNFPMTPIDKKESFGLLNGSISQLFFHHFRLKSCEVVKFKKVHKRAKSCSAVARQKDRPVGGQTSRHNGPMKVTNCVQTVATIVRS